MHLPCYISERPQNMKSFRDFYLSCEAFARQKIVF